MDLESLAWTLIEARNSEGSILVRHRHFPSGFQKDQFPSRLNVFWAMSEASDNGMPFDTESERMRVFEDRLVAATERDLQSVISMVLTGKGQREFVIHTRDPQEFVQRLTEMPQEEDPYPIEIHHTEDPTWEYVDRVLSDLS